MTIKQKYQEKLESCKKLLHDSQNIGPSLEAEKMFDDGHALMEELLQTKDTEVLCELFDLFTEELDYTGICETLENGIRCNFTELQIIGVLYKKFDQLIVNNISRAIYVSQPIVEYGFFSEFRKMFNNVASQRSLDFLNEFCDFYPELENEIAILREDMQKW